MDQTTGVYARRSAYLDRYVQVGIAGGRVIRVTFPTDPPGDASDDHPILDEIERYLDGIDVDLQSIETALTVPTDERAVLEAVREIPYGVDRTLAELATATPTLDASDEEDVQRVAAALSANPIPLVIPDHRVRDGPSAAPTAVRRQLRALEGL